MTNIHLVLEVCPAVLEVKLLQLLCFIPQYQQCLGLPVRECENQKGSQWFFQCRQGDSFFVCEITKCLWLIFMEPFQSYVGDSSKIRHTSTKDVTEVKNDQSSVTFCGSFKQLDWSKVFSAILSFPVWITWPLYLVVSIKKENF